MIHEPQCFNAFSFTAVHIVKLSLSHKGVYLNVVHIGAFASAYADGEIRGLAAAELKLCLLYTSDAADE